MLNRRDFFKAVGAALGALAGLANRRFETIRSKPRFIRLMAPDLGPMLGDGFDSIDAEMDDWYMQFARAIAEQTDTEIMGGAG